ncbi:MAG: organoarsenical effux MFS transporter ArsJ [Gammaproteobacteria bacterium]|nr:organoarsenical effux MFS transporter ArsJ [Gammaproteobacteria bacterium]MCP5137684.1 organoarsenical effux MFS transporter ArsJ [Gammaproteobacteria bacterium]
MNTGLRHYLTITLGYWAFTLTDGAIRMLVVLYFHQLGYQPLEIAMLFLFYEFFGVVTNLIGGWLGARIGLNATMHIGMAMQVVALGMLGVDAASLTVPYVMAAQALSGIAKDLNKMSAKASVKLMVAENSDARLFRWVAVLTGSKNSLKGAGFFIGAALLAGLGFDGAVIGMAALLAVVLIVTWVLLPGDLGKTAAKPKFTQIFAKTPAVNWLSAARFFLFGARDVWFVVGLPVFLSEALGWAYMEVGGFLALWIIGYGVIQASAPKLIRRAEPDGSSATTLAFVLAAVPALIALALHRGIEPTWVLIVGLALFGIVFALNSAVHSYLIVAWSDREKVSMNVGFYYMANAGGRLAGTVLSGWVYQNHGLAGCLLYSTLFIALAGTLSMKLPRTN